MERRKLYVGQCDRLRRSGCEDAWQKMIRQRIPIRREAFLRLADLAPLLDEGETPQEWFRANPYAKCYRSIWEGRDAVYVSVAGFEFIFADPVPPYLRLVNPRARREKQPWQMTFAEYVPWYRAQQTWFEDLPIARQYDLVAQHRREAEALEHLRFPFEAEWEGKRPILVTGMHPSPAAPGQMRFTYLDTGQQVQSTPYAGGITVGGVPLVHPLPRHDPSKETGFFAGGGINLGEHMRWMREIGAALERGERVPRRVLAEYRRLPLG